MFKGGWESVEDEPWAGCPLTSRTKTNEKHARDVFNTDRRSNVRMIAYALGID